MVGATLAVALANAHSMQKLDVYPGKRLDLASHEKMCYTSK